MSHISLSRWNLYSRLHSKFIKIRESCIGEIPKLYLSNYIASVVEQRESRSTSPLVSKVRTFGDLSTLSDWLGHRCRLVSLSPATSNRACVRRHRSVFLSPCPSTVDRCTMHTFNQRNDPRARSLYDRRNRMLSRDDKSIAEVAQEEVDGWVT